MTKWYDRIDNTIEMLIGNQWVRGTITNGYRTHDGLINMKTENDKIYWCGVDTEYIYFRKCEDSLGDLISNSDRIRSMSDEELAKWLTSITNDAQSDAKTRCDYQWLEWLREEKEES